MDLYKVEAILAKRSNSFSRKVQYKVKWVGYSEEEATWEPLANLSHLTDVLNQFEAQNSHTKANQPKPASQIDNSSHMLDSSNSIPPKDDSAIYQESSGQQSKSKEATQKKIRKPSKTGKERKAMARGIRRQKNKANAEQKARKASQQDGNQSAGKEQEEERGSREQKAEVGESKGLLRAVQKEASGHQEREKTIEKVVHYEGAEEPRQDSFVIKELCRRNQTFIYLVQDHGQSRWASKSEILREHPLALIEFYENRIKYTPKRKEQQAESKAFKK